MVEGIKLKDQYNVLKEIGSGAFGKVYMVEDMKNKLKYAIKRINKKELEENDYLHQAFWKELEVMRKCECEYSVKLIEHFPRLGHKQNTFVFPICKLFRSYTERIPVAEVYESDLYGDTTANLSLYGRLYSWYSAVNIPENQNSF